MKTNIFLLLIITFVLASCSPKSYLPADTSGGSLFQDLEYLASDELKGRETGTKGEDLAAEHIVSRFSDLGLSPKGTKEYYQRFIGYESNDPHGSDMAGQKIPVNGKNVVGFIDHGAQNTVVIGAHYDHLGMGGFGSLYQGPAEIHNGADDNASGVAVMIWLAEKLKSKKFDDNNYLFIAFSGEEKGLWGSNYWTKNPTYPLEQINYMINMDMVGRLENNRLAINGVGTSPEWTVLDDVNKKFELVKSESGIGPSDHSSFYLSDIPSIHFFTGQHEDYHKPSDDIEKVNIQGCYEIGNYILQVIDELDDKKIAFTKTKDETKDSREFKVTLGVIPDYMFQGTGMRIDGVKDGRTASNAGIQQGDVVIKMGDLEVPDMMGYMKALGAFEKGQTIPVVINREGKEMSVSVTFN